MEKSPRIGADRERSKEVSSVPKTFSFTSQTWKEIRFLFRLFPSYLRVCSVIKRYTERRISPRVDVALYSCVCARISKHKRATQNEYRSGALGRGFRSENYSGSGRIMDYKWWIALKLEYVTSVNVLFPLQLWLTLQRNCSKEMDINVKLIFNILTCRFFFK